MLKDKKKLWLTEKYKFCVVVIYEKVDFVVSRFFFTDRHRQHVGIGHK